MAREKNPSTIDEIDELFTLPLTDFTEARNALSARLKKGGDAAAAQQVKELNKPPVSAWAVNQLYWRHSEAFQALLDAGDRLVKAQASRLAGKSGDMRPAQMARRDALNELLRLVTALLNDAGHNPSPETLRRITATLEALSTGAGASGGPQPGRLTADVTPQGFDALAAILPKAGLTASDKNQETLTAAQAALKQAEARREEARTEAREAADRLERAKTALEDARRRLERATSEAENAMDSLAQADKSVDLARRELDGLLKKSKK